MAGEGRPRAAGVQIACWTSVRFCPLCRRPAVRLCLQQAGLRGPGPVEYRQLAMDSLLCALPLQDGGRPRRWRYPVLAALFLLFQAYAELTYATFLVLFTALWLVGSSSSRHRLPDRARSVAAGGQPGPRRPVSLS